MRISTLSIMIGSSACNLKCRYCISRTTYNVQEKEKLFVPSERLIDKAVRVFARSEGFTALITGKGEPTLVPHEKLLQLIQNLYRHTPVVEIQTNGILLTDKSLHDFAKAGLSTVAISCASYDNKINSGIMAGGSKFYWDLAEKVKLVIKNNLVLRLAVVATKGGIDNIKSFLCFIAWIKSLAPENYPLQVTIRKMGLLSRYELKDENSKKVANYIKNHLVDTRSIWSFLKENGQKIMTLPWGAEVFDYQGVGICVSDCLTIRPQDDTIRSAILYPDGHLRYSWEYPASIIF